MSLNDSIALDSALCTGILENGLRYYIAKNDNPPGKVVIQLGVRAGVVLQDTDQVELAHLLEHLAFGKTKHFRNVFGYMDSLGLQRGRDVDAGTGTDYTSYWAVFSAMSGTIRDRDLLVIRDFAQGIEFDPAAVDRERTVVMRELSNGSNEGKLLSDLYYPQILRGSRYGETFKAVSARMENLRNFDLRMLVRFYDDWYRPDLQAVTIVGDIDVKAVEQQVRRLFSDLKNPASPRPRPTFHVPLMNETRTLELTDIEFQYGSMQMFFKRARKNLITTADLKERLEEDLYTEMMRDRFQELGERYYKLYRSVNHHDQKEFYPDLNVLTTSYSLKKNDMKQGFQVVWRELERAVRHGFTASELDRAKRACSEKGDYMRPTVSSALAGYYARNFLCGDAVPGAADAYRLQETLLEMISLEDLHARAVSMINNPNRDFLMLAPPEDSLLLPDKELLLSWIIEVQEDDIKVKETTVVSDNGFLQKLSLLSGESRVEMRSYRKDVDVTELRFGNGVRVVLKPVGKVDSATKQGVRLYASRRGGASHYPRTEYMSALYAANIAIQGGLAGMDGFQLAKMLGKEGVEGRPFISLEASGFSGKSMTENAELLLQLMCEYFVHPVFDEDAFMDWREEMVSAIRANRNDPQAVFGNIIDSLKGFEPLNGPGSRPPFEYIDMDLARRIYKQHFVADRNLIVIIAGDFNVEDMVQLISRYVGSLPEGNGDNSAKKKKLLRPRKACTEIMRNIFFGRDTTRADISLFFGGAYRFSPENNFSLTALEILLQDVLSHRLRDVEGGTYSVFVRSTYTQAERSEYSVMISFSCFPRDVDRLVAAVMEEINHLATDGVTEAFSKSIRAKGKVLLAGKTGNCDAWVSYLMEQYESHANPAEILIDARRWDGLHSRDLQQSVRKLIRRACFSQFVRMPIRS